MPEIRGDIPPSPLRKIDTSFAAYVNKRQAAQSKHMVGGVPDYAFAMDDELRRKLMQVPGFYSVGRKLLSTQVAREMERVKQKGLAVGPNQFRDIYQMGVDCARRLGIGVPNMFVVDDVTMNAYTIAADDVSPIVVIHSGLVERMTPGELKCVIAHECGHIHNNHAILKCMVQMVMNLGSGLMGLGMAISGATMMLINFWTRAGEVTADRAALICCDDVQDALNVDFKFLYGAAMKNAEEMNLDALRQQMDEILNSPTRVMELGSFQQTAQGMQVYLNDHPGSIRRVFTGIEFTECETLYSWRPELKKPGTIVRSKQDTDERCKKLVAILDTK